MKLLQHFKQDLKVIDLRLLIVTSFACLLIVSYRYCLEYPLLKMGIVDRLLGGMSRDYAILYRHMIWNVCSFISMLLLPLLAMIMINKFSSTNLSPVKYTFSLGEVKIGLKLVALFVSVFVSILLLFMIFQPAHFDPYPACKSSLVLNNLWFFALFQFTQCLYMVSFEYFFRGFILFEAQRLYGYNAIAFTLLPYIIIKLGKGPVEIYTAILVGIFLAYMALKSKSFLYPALAHSSIAVANDVITLIIKNQN